MTKLKEKDKKIYFRKDIWNTVKGIWKDKKPDPLRYFKKIRKEWDRILIK